MYVVQWGGGHLFMDILTAAFCFYNLSSIVNGLVYFDQFSLIPPLHLGLVILGIFVLLGGVWVVSIQSGSPPGDGDAWSDEESVEGAISDLESETHYAECEPRMTAEPEEDRPPFARSTRSESHLNTFSSSPESTVRSPHSTVSQPLPGAVSQPTLRPSTSSRRRSQHLRAQTSTAYTSTPPAPNPVATLGAGFQIGLSPVSPGFAIVPRERGRIVSGLNHAYGFGDVVDDATRRRATERERRRRRTVSEGDARTRVMALERAELLSDGLPAGADEEEGTRTRAKARWRWLSTLAWTRQT